MSKNVIMAHPPVSLFLSGYSVAFSVKRPLNAPHAVYATQSAFVITKVFTTAKHNTDSNKDFMEASPFTSTRLGET